MSSLDLPVRIVEVPVPESLDDPVAALLRGAVAAERAAETDAIGYADLSDTPLEAWAWARNTEYARRIRLAAVLPDAVLTSQGDATDSDPTDAPLSSHGEASDAVVTSQGDATDSDPTDAPLSSHGEASDAVVTSQGDATDAVPSDGVPSHGDATDSDPTGSAPADAAGGPPGAVVGSAFLGLPTEDNAHLVEGVVRVDPAWQGRGVGSALAAALEARARAEGRGLIVAWTDHPAEPPEPADAAGESAILRPPTGSGRLPLDRCSEFATAHGYVLEQAERHSILDLPPDDALLTSLEAQARAAAGSAYHVVTWTDVAPQEWVDGYAVLHTRMSTDVPMAGLEIEEDVWDAERVRDLERTQQACGRSTLVAAAVHEPSGTLAAFTVLVVRAPETPDQPPPVFQDSTLVLREHRGHRLGMLVKVANARALQESFPAAVRVHTWNAEENAHMLAINVAMGFRPAGISGTWQKHLT